MKATKELMQIQWRQDDGSLKTLPVPPAGLTIGRGAQYDIHLPDAKVSGSHPHARILLQEDGCYIVDCRSKNGTEVDGRSLVPEQPARLPSGAIVAIGKYRLTCLNAGEQAAQNDAQHKGFDTAADEPRAPRRDEAREDAPRAPRSPRRDDYAVVNSIPLGGTETLPFKPDQKTVVIGRSADSDIRLDDAAASSHHAELTQTPSGYAIRDLNSKNGTFVNEKRITGVTLLNPGDRVRIGRNRFKLPEEKSAAESLAANKPEYLAKLKPVSDGRQIRLDAINLRREVDSGEGHLVLLQNVSLTIEPGEMVALIGGSGAGKTTLMLALNGYTKANSGQVLLNGVDFYQNAEMFSTTLGYVPQQDIVHGDLPVSSALRYAALLRLPPDTTEAEIEALTDRVLDQLSLKHRKNTLISALSGGERKRVNMGVELLTRPSLLFLDEPTTGLDAGTEKKVTLLMRDLAAAGCTIITVTHAVQTLQFYDKVIVMAPGGRLVYYGSLGPQDLKREFGIDDYADLYDQLSKRPAVNAAKDRPPVGAAAGAIRTRQSPVAQWQALFQRYVELMRNDRRNLLQLLIQTPFVGLLIILLFRNNRNMFDPAGISEVGRSGPKVALLMSLAMICFSLLNSYREFIKEAPIYRRERHVSLRIWPYILSKVVLLTGISFGQLLLLLVVVNSSIPLHLSQSGLECVIALLLVGSINATLMGLLVSALSKSSDQATTSAGLLLLTQVIFSGFVFVNEGVIKNALNICAMRWMYGGVGGQLKINELIGRAANRAGQALAGDTLFDTSFQDAIRHLSILAVVMLCLVWFALWLPEEIALRKGVQA